MDCTQTAAAADEDVLVVSYASALLPLAGGVLASLAASLAHAEGRQHR